MVGISLVKAQMVVSLPLPLSGPRGHTSGRAPALSLRRRTTPHQEAV